jgi:signal transduction histidine kinase/DNA-binding response OmpR family regulator
MDNERIGKTHSIALALGIPFGILVLILAGFGWLALNRMDNLNRETDDIFNQQWLQEQLGEKAVRYSNLNNRLTMQILLMDNYEAVMPLIAKRVANSESISRLMDQIEKSGLNRGEEEHLFEQIKATRTPYRASYEKALDLFLHERLAGEARSWMLQDTLPKLISYHEAWLEFLDLQVRQVTEAVEQRRAAYLRTRELFILQLGSATIVAIAIAFFVTRKMTTEVAKRERAEHEIKLLNANLEQKVILRTRDIARITHELEIEVVDRKCAEKTALEAQRVAETAARAKSDFLANMSHEIRTPMNGIQGMIELVLDTELTGEQLEYLTMARSSAESLLTLLNDILDYSKIEAGKLDIETIEFSLRDCLGDAFTILSLRAHEKGLELICDIGADVPDALLGDPGRLRQVASNLVGNAIKFTEKGEIVATVICIAQSKDEADLKFTISDTGIGIAPEQQTQIFGAFTQADNSTTRKYGGTGLGLSISSRLVGLMGGRIWVESVPGRGSHFHFTARLKIQESPGPRSRIFDNDSLKGLSALIIDDSSTNRKILLKMLEGWKIRAVAVESAAKAMEAMEAVQATGGNFRLVLLDAQMPQMDGFAFAAMIRQNPDWAPAAIVMLTSVGRRGDASRCRELGIAAYVPKPIKQSDLFQVILASVESLPKSGISPALITRHSMRDNRRKLRILLAEDNAVNQKLTTRLIEKRGHTVRVAVDGEMALAELSNRQFDLVIMDVQMPGMGGFETTRAIRETEKTTGRHIPIIAMTAHAMKGDKERCLAEGMDAYLSKPINGQVLCSMIEELCPPSQAAAEHNDSTLESVS